MLYVGWDTAQGAGTPAPHAGRSPCMQPPRQSCMRPLGCAELHSSCPALRPSPKEGVSAAHTAAGYSTAQAVHACSRPASAHTQALPTPLSAAAARTGMPR